MKRRVWYFALAVVLVLIIWFSIRYFGANPVRDVGMTELADAIRQGQVERIEVHDSEVLGFSQEETLRAYKEEGTSIYDTLRLAGLSEEIIRGLAIEIIPASIINRRDFTLIVPYILLVIALGLYIYFVWRSNRSPTQGFNEWTEAPGNIPATRFRDIAGYQQTKRELIELVEYLRSPDVFKHLGAEIPRNVLLVGPPGTGKTQLARAVANSAGAHVFYGSGAQFVELFVGVGAARVRSLFKQAKAQTPSVVFIDELDALARKRAPAAGGSTQEHDHALNELLSQLDGFLDDKDHVVIFIGATNREEVLDPALVQRMNRKIYVGLPKPLERKGILQIHAGDKNLGWSGENIDDVVEQTTGFSGRELKEIVHESPRQTYQRLIQIAIEKCQSQPDLDLVLPVSGQIIKSPAQLAGHCYPGSSVTIQVASNKIKVEDEDGDGIWTTLMGLTEGSYDLSITWEKAQNGRPKSHSVHFGVSNQHQEIELQDVTAALRRLGAHIPKIDLREPVVDALQKRILGQSQALRSVATAAAMHYSQARFRLDRAEARPTKSHVLLIGPSGVGKTHLARSLAEVLGVPFAVVDMEASSSFSAITSEPFRKLLIAANGNAQKARFGIICIQGFDSLAGKDPKTGGIWRSAAQDLLYSLMEGDKLDVPVLLDGYNSRTISLETQNIFYICEGNFNELLQELVKERGAERLQVTHEDLVAFGFSADLVGCISSIIGMNRLDVQEIAPLVQANNPDNILVEYERFLSDQGVNVIFSPDVRQGIANEVLGRGLGVRMINAIMHNLCRYILENRDLLDRQESGGIYLTEEHLRDALARSEERKPLLNVEQTKAMPPQEILKDVLGLEGKSD